MSAAPFPGHVVGREVGFLLSDVKPEPVTWLWHNVIPAGKFVLLDGNPGDGKSALSTELAARISIGADMPDGSPCQRAGVVMLSAEDGYGDTIRPRLEVAGADLSRVVGVDHVPDSNGGHPPLVPNDLDELERAIDRVQASILVLDPLVAFLPGGTDSNKDADVRRALSPLSAMGNRRGVAILGIRHLNKTPGGLPIYRGGGSIAFIGAARAGLLVSRDPDDENKRVLAPTKFNLGPAPGSLAFTIEDANGVARIRWLGASQHTARSLLAADVDEEERTAVDDARQFLTEALGGGPVAAKELVQAARDAGISERTLRRAKSLVGARARKSGARGGWSWELARDPGEDDAAPF